MRRRVWVLAAAVLLSGCDLFGPSGPGVMNATLTATSDLGAVVLEVVGPSVTGIEAQGDTRAYSAPINAAQGRYRVVLVASTAGAMRFGIEVDDLGAEPPGVVVITAADTQNLPTLATGIEVRVER